MKMIRSSHRQFPFFSFFACYCSIHLIVYIISLYTIPAMKINEQIFPRKIIQETVTFAHRLSKRCFIESIVLTTPIATPTNTFQSFASSTNHWTRQ